MPPTRSLSIAPDLDALEVALVRSIENIRKTLPQNRRQSQDLPTISFSQGQNGGPASNTPLDAIEENRGLVTGGENRRKAGDSRYDGDPLAVAESSTSAGPSWKKYIRESEALALELQMESVRQDMRDLAGARERRYQELTGRGDPTRRKLRRVSEVLPQNRANHFVSRSNSEGSRGAGFIGHMNDPAAGRRKAGISNVEGPEVDSIGSSSMITYNNPFKSSSSSSSSRPPHVRNPGKIGLYILPTTSETCGLSPRHDRSRPTANSRPFSVPAPVSSNFGIAKPTKADFDQKSYHKGASSANSGGSPQNRHSSEGSRAGRKPQKIGEKKVRFAVGIEKGPPAEIYGRKLTLNNSSSSSLSSQVSTSNSSDGNMSESESRSFSSTDDGTSGSELYSLSSSEDEEPRPTTVFKHLRTPLGPLDQTGRRIPPQKSPGPKPLQKGSTVAREVNEKDQNKPGGLIRHLSTNSKAKKTTPKEIRPLEDGEKFERSRKNSGSNIDSHKTLTSDRSLPQHTNPHQFNLSRSNSIRGLLRKHSGNLLNKFSWRGNKASGLSKPPIETRGLACVGCRELFDANLLIQVPAKCLHLYCKSCLKGTFSIPRCHIHSAITSSPVFSDVHSGLEGPSQRMSSSVL